MDSLAGAGETLTDYINQRVEEIDQMHQLKLEKLSVLAENHADVYKRQIETSSGTVI